MSVTQIASAAENEPRGITLRDMFPSNARRLRIRVGDVELGYSLIEPEAPARGTALLVSGYTSSYDTFNPLLTPLAENGFRVIGLSQRGQPHSSGSDDPDDYSLGQLGQDLHDFLLAIGVVEPVHLLGHSFGGVVAIEAVLDNPKRFASVTLWNSGPRELPAAQAMFDAVAADGPRGLWVLDRLHAGLDPNADQAETLSDVERYFYDRLMTTNPAQIRAGVGILLTQVDRTAELADTKLPFLVSHGANDNAWPIPWQHEMAERLAADYVVIAGAGHSAHADRPNFAADVLSAFWSSAFTLPS